MLTEYIINYKTEEQRQEIIYKLARIEIEKCMKKGRKGKRLFN